MNITIVGAGNIGLAITGTLALNKKNKITLFTSNKKMNRKLILFDVEKDQQQIVTGFDIVNSAESAFSKADVIFCTYPANLRKAFIDQIEIYLRPGTKLGFVPGYGGAEYFCRQLIEKGVVVFGLQRVPFVARHTCKDEVVIASILSKKSSLYTAAIPKNNTSAIADMLEELFQIPTVRLKEYLAITLAPSNPLLHLSGLYNVFKNYKKGDFYNRPMKLYEEWNDETSKLLFEYDAELQEICKNIYSIELDEVVPLAIYYESATPFDLTKKLKSIKAFKEVMVPLRLCGEKYQPDLSNRMFIEDYPYGICIIKAFALMTGVNTPVIDKLLDFYKKLSGYEYFKEDGMFSRDIEDTAVPQLYGLNNIEDIIKFYQES